MAASKHIALIGYASPHFYPFGRALEAAGFKVYWVHSLRSFTHYLLGEGVPRSRILDVSDSRQFEFERDAADRELSSLERADLPRINDIILMDRRLRTRPYGFALAYLAHVARSLRNFYVAEQISLITSGRDTALQLLSLLVARECGVLWAGMTYLRLPIERFMFTASDHTDEILPLGDVRPEHARAAREYLKSFRSDSLLPYVRPSSITWGSVLRRLPLHFAAGWQLLLQARYDAGNRFARYPLIDIAKMYLRKKRNLLQANLFLKTHDEASNRPYVLFGLHRQPESSIDVVGAYFSDQTYLIRTIARSIPAGYDLLVKVHISDADGWPLRFYRTLEAIPAVRLISPTSDTRKLLLGAELTVTNSGTMAYEAGLLGRPAITFSRVHYNELPTIRYCTSPTELPELIDELLRRGRKPGDDVAIEAFLARMYAWSAPGLPNREIFSVPLTDLDLESLINAYEALFARHAQRREPRNAIREA